MTSNQVGKGFLRGQQSSELATAEARALQRANADNPQIARGLPAHDTSPESLKVLRSLKHLPPSSHGGIVPVTSGPPSAKPPQPAK